MDDNVWEIQDLYMDKEQQEKGKGKVKEEEVILIKLYEVSESSSTKSSSFIDEEVDNLIKHMKFVKGLGVNKTLTFGKKYQWHWWTTNIIWKH